MNKQIIPVVFPLDDNYAPYCGVAIYSLIKNANPDNLYKIYIIYDKLLPSNIRRLESLSTDYAEVNCICIHQYVSDIKVTLHNYFAKSCVYRLVIPDVLKQYKKILYLDSDIIVNADVADLFHIDTGDHILGAVREAFNGLAAYITQTLKLSRIDNFLNSGILLINTHLYKENDIAGKCFELLAKRDDLIFLDQCALSIICEGKVCFLPETWNYEVTISEDEERKTDDMHEPAIIHFNGPFKPWYYPTGVLAEYFWKYVRQTIFYEEILQAASLRKNAESIEKKYRELFETVDLLVGMYGARDMKVAVYGAGNVGKKYIERMLSMNLCNIAVWVDKNSTNIQGTVLPVVPVEKLYETEFDRVIIAIADPNISVEVEDMLIENGVPGEKIIRRH